MSESKKEFLETEIVNQKGIKMRNLKSVFLAMVMIGLVGCAGLQTQDEMTEFMTESMAMVIGYEMKGSFDWTDTTEQYYQAVLTGNIDFDGAQIAAGYLKEVTHPVIADRMISLAVRSGIDLDSAGNVIGIENVKLPLLKAAAIGFKTGLFLED